MLRPVPHLLSRSTLWLPPSAGVISSQYSCACAESVAGPPAGTHWRGRGGGTDLATSNEKTVVRMEDINTDTSAVIYAYTAPPPSPRADPDKLSPSFPIPLSRSPPRPPSCSHPVTHHVNLANGPCRLLKCALARKGKHESHRVRRLVLRARHCLSALCDGSQFKACDP